MTVHGKSSSVGVERVVLLHPAYWCTKNSATHSRIKDIPALLPDKYIDLGRRVSSVLLLGAASSQLRRRE